MSKQITDNPPLRVRLRSQPCSIFEKHYSPSPSGRGQGEDEGEDGRALAGPMLPDAEVKTAVVTESTRLGLPWEALGSIGQIARLSIVLSAGGGSEGVLGLTLPAGGDAESMRRGVTS